MSFVSAIIAFLISAVLYAFLGALFLMMALGNLHDVWNTVPALGFWETLSVSIWLGAFISMYSTNFSSNSK